MGEPFTEMHPKRKKKQKQIKHQTKERITKPTRAIKPPSLATIDPLRGNAQRYDPPAQSAAEPTVQAISFSRKVQGLCKMNID